MRHSYFATNFSLPAVPPPDGLPWIQPPPSGSRRWILRYLPLGSSEPRLLRLSSRSFRMAPPLQLLRLLLLPLPRLLPRVPRLQPRRRPFRHSRRNGSRPDKSCRPSSRRYPEFPSTVPESSPQAARDS